jgi:hypothetical protein
MAVTLACPHRADNAPAKDGTGQQDAASAEQAEPGATGLIAVPGVVATADLRLFRNAVRVGLSEVRRTPGANKKQLPARLPLECLNDREADVHHRHPGRTRRKPLDACHPAISLTCAPAVTQRRSHSASAIP